MPDRRKFLAAGAATLAAPALFTRGLIGERFAAAAEPDSRPWLRKTLKDHMIQGGDRLSEKYALAKQAGFDGVEVHVPGINVNDVIAARDASGLTVDGSVGNYHWNVRHTDPDPDVRARAQKALHEGLRQTASVGGTSMLLVPGHGMDGTSDEVRARAVEAIRAALPIAEEAGVSILIENVWNHFLYDHDGGPDQTADAMAAFVDEFDSPLVGMQFDIGNHHKYGDVAAWIRTLGSRIKKLDIKGYSRASGQFVPITEGTIDWPAVKAALREIGFTGWLAAEVGGGDLDRLKQIAGNMDAALQCDEPA